MRERVMQVNQGAYTSGGARRLCEALNAEQHAIRNPLARIMQAYMKEKGYVDAWPVPGNGRGVTAYEHEGMEKTQEVTLAFDFFASDFYVREDGNKKLICRGYSKPWALYESGLTRPQELVKRDERLQALRGVRKVTKKERTASNLKMLVSAFPLVILGIFAVLLALWYVTGADPKAMSMNLLTLIPAVFYPFLSLHPAVLWGAVIALLVMGVFAMALLADGLNAEWISQKTYLAGVAAQEEIERNENDKSLEAIEKEYIRLKNEDRDFAAVRIGEWRAALKEHGITR